MAQHPLSHQALVKCVQTRIAAMGGDEFEEFCYELLSSSEPGFENLQPSFSALGKVRKGKCDMHVYHHDSGRFTAVTCTTQQAGLTKKTREDVDKLKNLDIAPQIRTVLACIASNDGEAVMGLYDECSKVGWHFEPRTLQRLAKESVDCESVMRRFFNEFEYPTAANAEASQDYSHRCFLAGERLKKIRDDLRYNEAEFIALVLDYPSQLSYREVEADRLDIAENHLALAAQYSGADLSWVKMGVGVPYRPRRIRRYDFGADRQDADALAGEAKHAFVALDASRMRAVLLIEEGTRRWSWWKFDDDWGIWGWIWGDEKYVPEFLQMLRQINRRYHPSGLLVSAEQFDALEGGQIHPGNWQATAGRCLPWFDDLFDYHHQYKHLVNQYANYGEWFLKMQETFRQSGGEKQS